MTQGALLFNRSFSLPDHDWHRVCNVRMGLNANCCSKQVHAGIALAELVHYFKREQRVLATPVASRMRRHDHQHACYLLDPAGSLSGYDQHA
jgi:hypothetical protein